MRLRRGNTSAMNKCPICNHSFKDVVTIQTCSHRFCLRCIMEKISEESLHNCPVCNLDLGSAPLQQLRVSSSWKNTKANSNAECHMEEDDQTEQRQQMTCNLSNEKQKEKDLAQGSSSKIIVPKLSDIQETQMGKSTKNAVVCLENVQGHFDSSPKEKLSKTKDSSARTKKIRKRVSQELVYNKTTEVMTDESKKNDKSFWFALVASDNQKTEAPLDQIPSRYLRVRDGSITVLSIKKYLVQKLNLTTENEVEISMEGHQLLPTMQVRELLDLWVHTTSPSYTTKTAFEGCSAEEFVMNLRYGRKPEI